MTPTTTCLARRSGALLLAAALPLLLAGPASAEVPEGWSDPEEVSVLQLLVVTLGIPAVLFLLIAAAVLVPALAKGEKLLPNNGTPDQWFGGPGRPTGELGSGSAAAGGTREIGRTGGASGTW